MTFQDIFKSSFLSNMTSVSLLDMAVALALAFGIGMFIFLIYKKTFAGVMYIVVLRCENHDSEIAAMDFLKKQVRRCVVKSKAAQKGMIEMNVEIRMKEDNTEFINILAEMNGVTSAVLVSYNGDYMG